MRYIREGDPHRKKYGRWSVPDSPQWHTRHWEYEAAEWLVLPDDAVVDAGAGDEHWFKDYLAGGVANSVTAIDTKYSGSTQKGRLTELEGDIKDIPLPDDFADIVLCISVIEHIKHDHGKILQEFHRVLKPGGRCYITFDVRNDLTVEKFIRVVNDSPFTIPATPEVDVPEDVVRNGQGQPVYRTVLWS